MCISYTDGIRSWVFTFFFVGLEITALLVDELI